MTFFAFFELFSLDLRLFMIFLLLVNLLFKAGDIEVERVEKISLLTLDVLDGRS